MARLVAEFNGLEINPLISPCAHTCRYCSIGDRTFLSTPVSRLIALYDRFLDWKTSAGRDDFHLQWGFLGPSFNFDRETLTELIAFEKRIDRFWGRFPLGGLKMRSEPEMREWLRERQQLGYHGIAASMAGHGAVHDRWNGRHGDFEFMMMTQRLARELGMEVHQGFFLIKNTLPILDETVNILDAQVGQATERYARLFMTAGYGSYWEDQRLTESDLVHLPAWVKELISEKDTRPRAEREWIALMRSGSLTQKPWFGLHLNVDQSNIDRLEQTSCAGIIAELEQATRKLYSAMPSQEELREEFGDPHGTRLYDASFDLERSWLDRYVEKYQVDWDWSFLPYYVGRARSRKPPQLAEIQLAS